MKHKVSKQFTSILLALVMIISMIPVTALTAFAAEEVKSEVKWGDNERIQFTLDDSGVLTWSVVPGATSYDLNIYMHGSLFKSEEGNTSRSYDLVNELNKYKKDSGTVQIIINANGVEAGNGDRVSFMYSSPYPKLEAPSDLKWDVNGNADWDDVANADGYTLYLYQPSGGAYNHYDLADSYFNCTNYPDVATRISDGWYFAVRATSTGSYRPSEYNESYRRGHVIGSGLTAGTMWGNNGIVKFTVTDTGALTWSEVPGATSYDLNIWMGDGLFKAVNGLTSRFYALQEELNNARKDSGTVKIALIPKGNNVADKSDGVYLLYSSPYGKLEAPTNLYWNGNIAGWSAVDGAESYTVYLYQPGGSGYNHWTTTDTYFDFSSVATIGEDWFFAVKATASNARDSVYNESPRYTGPVSTTLYTIGAYAYDDTLSAMDSGGQVYLETNAGVVDWTSAGETCPAVEGTAVTVKAAPTPGYVFVEWRQGTQGATISREAEYSFTATGDKFLYAIFRQKGANEIAEVVGKIPVDRIPREGMEVTRFIPGIPDGEPYGRYWNGSEWRDENGVLISANIGHHYDHGYEFEAGRSYTTDGFYFEAYNGYTFAENATVHLMGPERSMWDYEVTGFNDDRTVMFVRFTFRIPGERTYPDINKVSMVYYGTHADGGEMPDPARLIYNNCAITREEWNTGSWGSDCTWDTSTGENRFEAGNTYVHMIELTALPGYKFSENLLAQKGMQGEEEYGVVSLSDDRTVATVTYTYDISDIEYLNTVTLEAKAGDENFYLVRQGDNNAGGLPFTTTYTLNDTVYEIRFENYYDWYDVETGKEILSITNTDLEVGKKYRLEFYVMIKDEFDETHRFGENPALVLKDYQCANANFVQIETDCDAGATQMKVSITYTAQPKPGEGSGAHYPIVCYSYDEFKYAMESSDIRYVALGDVEDMLPMIPHDEEKEPDGITRTAIVVRGQKDLNLLGNAVFRCPLTENYDLKYYIQLLTLTDAANSSLYIHGNGSLTYEGGTLNFVNSGIKMEGGHLTVDGATIRGSNGYHTGFCYGINAIFGSVSIQGGATVIGEIYGGEGGIGALTLGSEGVNRSLSVSIFDGKFYVERDEGDSNEDHGIMVNNDIGLRIYGMSTDGIRLGRYAADTLDDYVMEGCVMTVNGVNTDPATRGTTDGYVEVYQEISEVEIYVETPVAGESATVYPEEVYWVPEGCTVDSIVWYKNGEALNLAYAPRFEAGSSYRVEVTLVADNGVRFANPLTSAEISYKTATVNAHSGNAQKGIVMSVDFGECPNIISEVDLTVTAPKEGQTPSYTVGCGSDAYYAVGGSSNYTEYRKWYMSSDGYDWWEINSNHNFMSGYYYKLVVDIRTNNGYEFPLIDNGTIQPNVSATVNGYYANVIKAYEQDPSRYITVEYDFGECSDSIVEKITVENVTAPVAGEKPNYNCSVRGSGYQMNTAKNNENYGVRNGMQWMTDDWDYVFPNDTFVPGKTYICRLNLVTDDGFAFAQDKDYRPTVTATVNGKAAVIEEDWTKTNEARLYYTFTCAQPVVDSVVLYGLDEPQAGNTPDAEVTTAYPEHYVIDSIRWLDEEDGVVNSFEQGRMYTAEITVSAKEYDSVDGCIFADSVTAYIDGKEVTGWSNSVTVNNDNTLTVRYGFRKGASAPTVNPYVFVTRPVGTTVNAGQTHTAYWQTSFIPTQTEIQYWDGEAWDQWDVQEPEKAIDNYDFVNANAASYRFRIVAYIGNDAVATSNEFVITWEETQEFLYAYYPGEGSGTGDSDIVTAGKQITLADSTMFTAPAGKQFKAWAIGSVNGEQKQPGEQITITAETYIYAIWEEIPHTHKYDKLVAEDIYKVSPATCTKKAVYYKSCVCGEKGTATFEAGSLSAHNYTAATCTEAKTCKVCGATSGSKLGHTYEKKTTKATLTKDGIIKNVCKTCGYTASKTTTIYKASSVKLSKTSYTYNGKVQKPSVVVKDSKGNTISSSHYTVTYPSGMKNAGTYKVTVKFKGNYSGTKTLSYTIKAVDVSKCKFSLSATSYTYNGKAKKPTVTVKNANGTKLTTSSYTVTYASGRKNAGTYKVTIKMKGNYTGTKTLTFKINPVNVSKCKITLSTTSYTYNGTVKKPAVTVKNASGTKLTTSSYTVTYASGRKNVGTYKVTIKMKGNYTGTKTLTFKINPSKTTISKLTAGKKSIKVAITKKSTQVTGYQIQYSTSKKFTNAKTKTISSYKTTKYTLKSLSAKKTYYVRVRTYKTVGKTKYYSGWSTYKYKKTK